METKQHFGFHEAGVFLIAPIQKKFVKKTGCPFLIREIVTSISKHVPIVGTLVSEGLKKTALTQSTGELWCCTIV